MNVLLINGSPRPGGNTALALAEMEKIFQEEGIETVIMQVGGRDIRGCIACGRCGELGRCVFDDDVVNPLIDAICGADGVVIGTPVYFCAPNGALMTVLNRVFYAGSEHGRLFEGKLGASVATMWRSGGNSALAALDKYFMISGMPVVPNKYWNMYFSPRSDLGDDGFGKENLQNLGRTMAEMLLKK